MLLPITLTVTVAFIILVVMPSVFEYDGLFIAADTHEDIFFSLSISLHSQPKAFTIALTINGIMYAIGYSLSPDSKEE